MGTSASASLPQNMMRGIILIVGTMFVTSVQDVVFKLFSASLPLGQIFVIRALIAIPLLIGLAWMQGYGAILWRLALSRWTLFRAFFITLLFLAFYGGIPFVSLSVLGAGTYTAPIFVVLFSLLLIREPIRLIGWIAILIGFVGVLVLLQPGTDAFSIWAMLPVVGAGFYAFAHVITRVKCQDIPPVALALALKLMMLSAGLLATGAILIWQPTDDLVASNPYLLGAWQPLSGSDWGILTLLAVLTVIIGLGMAAAYQATQPTTVATFEYCYLVFAAMWDVLFFNVVLGTETILGIALIIGAGIVVMRQGSKP